MEMVMPSTYRALENDEMMYLEGGWDWNTLTANIKGIWQKSAGFRAATPWKNVWSITVSAVKYAYTWVCAMAGNAAIVGWWIAGTVIATGAAATFALGQWRMF